MKNTLIISSASIDNLEACINKYFYTNDYKIDRTNFILTNEARTIEAMEIMNKNYLICKRKNRYRLEYRGD